MTGSNFWQGNNASTGCGGMSVDAKNPNVVFASLWDFRRKGWTFRSGGDGESAATTGVSSLASCRSTSMPEMLPPLLTTPVVPASVPEQPQRVASDLIDFVTSLSA